MLNEKVDFENLHIVTIVAGIVFLIVMWGGFYLFVKFKRRDDARRQRFQDIHKDP